MTTDKRDSMTGEELGQKLLASVKQMRAPTNTPSESFGDRLAAIGRKHGVTAHDIEQVDSVRDRTPAAPTDYFQQQARTGDLNAALAFLSRAGGQPPADDDRLPGA
ncbi:hypothetical protein [Ottowia sp.]|uniref:hypothetical protein n=1 Tax=Ottowia sp. TaxID=1898956 RepID=UPI0039E3926E